MIFTDAEHKLYYRCVASVVSLFNIVMNLAIELNLITMGMERIDIDIQWFCFLSHFLLLQTVEGSSLDYKIKLDVRVQNHQFIDGHAWRRIHKR